MKMGTRIGAFGLIVKPPNCERKLELVVSNSKGGGAEMTSNDENSFCPSYGAPQHVHYLC
jgi:hypothetical protein